MSEPRRAFSVAVFARNPDGQGFAAFGQVTAGMDVVRRIVAGAKERLNSHGILVVEIGNEFPNAEAAFPDLELTWLSTSAGDGSVFLLTADQL